MEPYTKQTSKQNVTRDTEIKNKLTVTRGELEGDNEWGEKGEGLSRNMYEGHTDKAKGGRIKGGSERWPG